MNGKDIFFDFLKYTCMMYNSVNLKAEKERIKILAEFVEEIEIEL